MLLICMKNFWNNLDKPILAMAPMAGITDSAFRQICAEFGADVLYSEMGSVNALKYSPEKTLELLAFDKTKEPNYVVQLFGSDPENFETATKIITKKIKPSGIDINFGCPVSKVAKQGAGAELMRDFKKSREVIKAVIDNTSLPVSIKTRAKVGDKNVLDFLDFISDLDIKALMIHGRTLAQGFKGEIDTEIIKKARNYFGGIILANGGVMDDKEAKRVLDETQVDGLGIARGALGKPWIFFQIIKHLSSKPKQSEVKRFANSKEIFKLALKHAKLAEKLKGKQGIIEMRKHLCWYAQGIPSASKMRNELVRVENMNDIKKILK